MRLFWYHYMMIIQAKETEYPFMIQPLNKLGICEMYLDIIHDAIDEKPTSIIILNDEMPKPVFLRSGANQGFPFITNLFNIVMAIERKKRFLHLKGRSTISSICR